MSDSGDDLEPTSKSALKKERKENRLSANLTLAEDDIGSDDEVFIVKVPVSVEMDRLHDADLTARLDNVVNFCGRDYATVVEWPKSEIAMVVKDRKGRCKLVSQSVRGTVSMREHVVVPTLPKIEVPPRYIVPFPTNTVTRHPIYGKEFGSNENVSPKKKRKIRAIEEVYDLESESSMNKIIKQEPTEETGKKHKKKKNKS